VLVKSWIVKLPVVEVPVAFNDNVIDVELMKAATVLPGAMLVPLIDAPTSVDTKFPVEEVKFVLPLVVCTPPDTVRAVVVSAVGLERVPVPPGMVEGYFSKTKLATELEDWMNATCEPSPEKTGDREMVPPLVL